MFKTKYYFYKSKSSYKEVSFKQNKILETQNETNSLLNQKLIESFKIKNHENKIIKSTFD